jgi:hypothetical protein
MEPKTIYDTYLSTNVDLYQIGLPDPFGANALIWFDNSTSSITYPDNSPLSALNGKKMWMTINITRLDPSH